MNLGACERYKGLLKVQHEDDDIDVCEQPGSGLFPGCVLSEHETDFVDKLLRGALPLSELPRVAKHAVRLYIGGEFGDCEEERSFMMSDTIPDVRAYSRNKYGIDLQIVDLKSVTSKGLLCSEAECLRELDRYQQPVMGVWFVGFVGDHQGERLLPLDLLQDDIKTIKGVLVENGHDVTSLDAIYTLDSNSAPPTYYQRTPDIDECSVDRPDTELRTEVKCLLEKAHRKLAQAENVSSAGGKTHLKSVIEREICEMKEHNQCLLYVRRKGKTKTTNKRESTSPADTIQHGVPGVISDTYSDVISKEFSDMLPSENVLIYDVPKYGKNSELKQQEYLRKISSHFFSAIRDLLDKRAQGIQDLHHEQLFRIITENCDVMKLYSRNFVGREEELEVVRYYILSESDQPLVITGESGSGKTALLARATVAVNEAIISGDLPMKTSLIIRFLGHTGNTWSPQMILRSLCQQLLYLTSTKAPVVPSDYEQLQMMFVDLLQRGEFGGVVVIVLDGVDSLDMDDPGGRLGWIPSRIVPNIKLIVSANSSNKCIVERLESKVNFKIIEIDHGLSFENCKMMFAMLMTDECRSVTYKQWEIIQGALHDGALPLFVRLLFDKAKTWRSFETINCVLSHNLQTTVNDVFDNLESSHGIFFVSRALGYLTVSRRGVSETEWEDILSLDNEVLNQVKSTADRDSIERLPSLQLVRLRHDIENYLQEFEIDNMQVLKWKHQMFADEARSRYCSEATAMKLNSMLADYYLGTWGGARLKPDCTQCDGLSTRTSRHVLEQPLTFESVHISYRFNCRKMRQLPFCLAEAKRFDELKSTCLCNFEYMCNRLKATSLDELILDYTHYCDMETELVSQTLRMSRKALIRNPSLLAIELLGRLLPHISNHRYVQNLLQQCDLVAQMYCSLVPVCQTYHSPGSLLQYNCIVDNALLTNYDVSVFTTPDGIFLLVSLPKCPVNYVWNLSTIGSRPDVLIPTGNIYPTSDGRFIAVVNGISVAIYKYDSGEIQGEFDFGPGRAHSVKQSRKYIAFPVEHGHGPVVIDAEKSVILHHFRLHSQAVDISKDDEYFVFNSGENIFLYQLPYMIRRSVGEASDVPCKMLFSSKHFKCYVLTRTNLLESVIFYQTNRHSTRQIVCSDIDIRDMQLSNDENVLLIHASRCLYLASTDLDKVNLTLRLPSESVTEKLYSFTAAGFSKNDDLVVASRGNSVSVWKTETGELIRVMEVGNSTLRTLYLSAACNSAVTVAADGSCSVLNLNNVTSDVPYVSQIHSNSVMTVCLSSVLRIAATHDSVLPEVKIFSLTDGKTIHTLQYSEDINDRVVNIAMSNNGKFIFARGQKKDDAIQNQSKNVLHTKDAFQNEILPYRKTQTDVILWETEKWRRIYQIDACKAAIFSKQSDLAVLVSDMNTDIAALDLPNGECRISQLPPGTEIVSEPHILSTDQHKYLIFITSPVLSNDETELATSGEICRNSKVMAFPLLDEQIVLLEPCDVIFDVDKDAMFLNVSVTKDDTLLMILKVNFHNQTNDVQVLSAQSGHLTAVIYAVESGAVLMCIPHFCQTDCIPGAIVSPNYLCLLDYKIRFFSSKNFNFSSHSEIFLNPSSIRFALDGRYAVGITTNKREIVVIRSADGVQRERLFVHGLATCLEVAEDGRTIIIGCADGRVMILTLILELSDPVRELLSELPSRQTEDKTNVNPLSQDMKRISSTSDLSRLSARMKSGIVGVERKPPTYQTLSNAVRASRQSQVIRSQTCSIQ